MRVIFNLKDTSWTKGRPFVCTIGNFDGMHLGHQNLIRCGLAVAKYYGLRFAVFTFNPNTKAYFNPHYQYLTSLTDKLKQLEACGVQDVICLNFAEIASWNSSDFIKYLVNYLNVAVLVVGENCRIGNDLASLQPGGVACTYDLQSRCKPLGGVSCASLPKDSSAPVSSLLNHNNLTGADWCSKTHLIQNYREGKVAVLGHKLLHQLAKSSLKSRADQGAGWDPTIERHADLHLPGRSGDAGAAERSDSPGGGAAQELRPCTQHNFTVSSSNIKSLIRAGRVLEVAKALGYYYKVRGKVIQGNQLGRTLGFPTTNLLVSPKLVQPKFGVYASYITLQSGERLPSVSSFGVRPTIKEGSKQPVLETFIFDFDRDLYHTIIEVELVKFIRPELKFSGLEELIDFIRDDVKQAKSCLSQIE